MHPRLLHTVGQTLLLTAVGMVVADRASAQGPVGVPDSFSSLYPSRARTFVKSSSDPLDFFGAQAQGNDDGFSGINEVECYREGPTNDRAVLVHQAGSAGFMGVFFRNFWSDFAGIPLMPDENNQTEFWVDGTKVHDQPLSDYFRNVNDPRGQVAPFSGPFTGNRSGAHLTHTNLSWNDEFRVVVQETPFDNANRFHKVAGTLTPPEQPFSAAPIADWERVDGLRGTWPHNAARIPQLQTLTMPGNGGFDEIQLVGPSTLLELRCIVEQHGQWSDLRVEFTWDGQSKPAVSVPLRFLGGMLAPPERYAFDTLLMGNDGDTTIRCFLPMHFVRKAQLRFINDGTAPATLVVTTSSVAGEHAGKWGYCHATYNHEITQTGETFRGPSFPGRRGMLRMLVLETRMNTLGTIPNMLTTHLEGDLLVRINGNRGDEHNFAASETSIGKWGWYLTPADQPFCSDFSFHSSYRLHPLPFGNWELARIQGSMFVYDPVHFVSGLDVRLEHGPQNTANADYGLFAVAYLEPGGAAREPVFELDVGNPSAETAALAQWNEHRNYSQAGQFFRDPLFGSRPITESIRELSTDYSFDVDFGPIEVPWFGYALELRIDRLESDPDGICQADIFVDGQPAGVFHVATHNDAFRFKEGGECEVMLPLGLTSSKTKFRVEIRPRASTDRLRLARVRLHGYLRR